MTRVTHKTSWRRFFLPLILLVAFIFWYRKAQTTRSSPKWYIVDFQIKDYRSQEKPLQNDFSDADRPYRAQLDDVQDGPAFQQQQQSYDGLQSRIKDFIQWERPSTDHWPAWHDYDNADYDPNRWEAMDRSAKYLPQWSTC